jgi:Fe-S-cluster containining protein
MPEWVRKGECNDCGWCCENVGRFEITAPPMDIEYLKVRGFRHTEHGYTLAGDFCSPCPAHIDNRCSIYEDRPQTCKDFPEEPNRIVDTPCSYWFEDELGNKVGGKGSPYGG